MSSLRLSIAVLGGSGALGMGLATRWAIAGHRIIIGSRREAAAREAAGELNRLLEGRGLQSTATGSENLEAAAAAELAVLTVPFVNQGDLLRRLRAALSGKILVDTTVPLLPPRVGTVQLPPKGSAAVAAQAELGGEVRVVSAFQNVAADKLRSLSDLDCDVLVSGDDLQAREIVIGLAHDAGLRGYHAGPLANSAAAEALTSVLITINRRHKCQAGIRIVGVVE
jgi:NADPH-dependent F420 reductase